MLNREDGKRVLTFIKEQLGVELPRAGLLAGQSITSILLYLYGKSNKVEVNDYDIFLPQRRRNKSWNFVPSTWARTGQSSFFKVERFDNFVKIDNNITAEERFKLMSDALINKPGLRDDIIYNARDREDTKLVALLNSANIALSLSELTANEGLFMFGHYNDYFMEYMKKPEYQRKNKIIFSNPDENSNTGYSIRQVFRKDLLNYVFVDAEMKDLMTPNPYTILTYFDLNCVQVAIDLKTQEIYYTRYFEHFMSSLQMIMVRTDRPYHSIIRYFNKKEQHGYYGNDELTVGMVNTMIALKSLDRNSPLIMFEEGNTRNNYNNKISEFGEGYRDKFQNSVLAKTHYRLNTRTVDIRHTDNAQHEERKYQLNRLKMRDEPLDYIMSGKHRGELEKRLGLKVQHYPFYATACLPSICHDHFGVFNASFGKKHKLLLKETKIDTRFECKQFTRELLFSEPDKFSGNLVKEHMNTIQDYFNKHPYLSRKMNALTFSEKYQIVKRLKTLEKHDYNIATYLDGAKYIDFHSIDMTRFEETIIANTKKFIEDIAKMGVLKETADLPSIEFEGIQIDELITQGQLDEEHRSLRHCVDGYGSRVKQRQCYILSFKSKEQRATMELCLDKNKKYRVRQFCKILNRTPNEAMQKAARHYLTIINPVEEIEQEGA